MFGRGNGVTTVNRLREEMDHLFENFFGPGAATDMPGAGYVRGFPAVNVWEDGENLYAEAEVPGLTMEDVEVYVVGNDLTIRGERKECQQQAFHRRERGVGPFQRVLPLPIAIDADKVEAKLREGVLLIAMPKAEAAKPRKIEVKGA
jgi:HSP20 family protein